MARSIRFTALVLFTIFIIFQQSSVVSSISDAELLTIDQRIMEVNGLNMHVAMKGNGPVVLLIHGFPQIWYAWRHQILALASLGYQVIAPDLRGYGGTDIPSSPSNYNILTIVDDMVALIDAFVGPNKKVFVVGHDWGAIIAWHLSLFRVDRVKALVTLSVPFTLRNPKYKPIETLRAIYGENYYICRFQAPGEMEAEFAELGTKRVIEESLTYRIPAPLFLYKGNLFNHSKVTPIQLPPWFTEQDIDIYTLNFDKTGFTGGFNYYRALDLNWVLTAPWQGKKIILPTKFIVGDLDLTYNSLGTKEYLQTGEMKKFVPLLEEVVVMKGVGHFIQEEKPNEINAYIYNFFKKF